MKFFENLSSLDDLDSKLIEFDPSVDFVEISRRFFYEFIRLNFIGGKIEENFEKNPKLINNFEEKIEEKSKIKNFEKNQKKF